MNEISEFSNWLRSHMKVRVKVGRPDNTGSAVYIWPWRITTKRLLQTRLPVDKPPQTAPPPDEVHFMLFATASTSPKGLATLKEAKQLIFQNPILLSGDTFFDIREELLSHEALAAIFTAAQLKLPLCVAYIIQQSPKAA